MQLFYLFIMLNPVKKNQPTMRICTLSAPMMIMERNWQAAMCQLIISL